MRDADSTGDRRLLSRAFWVAFGLNLLWINASEVARYFSYVMPMMRDAFPVDLNVAPMDVATFLIWGVWDIALVFSANTISWVWLRHFGATLDQVLRVGTVLFVAIFVIFWLGAYNMNLAPLSVAFAAWPWAWAEMVVAAAIVRWSLRRT